MLDKERILSKIDELDKYLNELKQIMPVSLSEYQEIEKKRSCERLLQLCIECIIDICKLFVSGLRLGLPAEENDLFDKMLKKRLLSKQLYSALKAMRGFRNILVREYAAVDDEMVFKALRYQLSDFVRFKGEILKALRSSYKK